MQDIIEMLKEKPYFYSGKGVSAEQIENSERELNVKFATDYREYLLQLGVASCGGHELTGICSGPAINVTDVTKKNRLENPEGTGAMYVIEDAHIDSIVIWQDSAGKIYQTGYRTKPVQVYKSLKDYISAF